MIDKNDLYILVNECSSPVSIRIKDRSMMIEGLGKAPLSYEDIIYLNSASDALRIGLLFFEDSTIEEEWYKCLKIYNWRDILHGAEIEDILLHPTMEGLQKILDIQNQQYFERIRGVFVGLRNAGYDISTKVDGLIRERYNEFANKIYKTHIQLKPTVDDNTAEIDEMKKQIAELKQMLADTASTKTAVVSESVKSEVVPTNSASEEKPVVKKTVRKKTSTATAKPAEKTTGTTKKSGDTNGDTV